MARSSGFKINKNLRSFLQLIVSHPEEIQYAEAIFEIRAIVGKYQALPEIESDLQELQLMESETEDAVDSLPHSNEV